MIFKSMVAFRSAGSTLQSSSQLSHPIKRAALFLAAVTCLFFYQPAEAAITTTSTVTGEDVNWSLSNINDSDIHFDHRVDLGSAEIFYYYAKLNKGANLTVQADIPNARQLTSAYTAQRKFLISIPSEGTRWVAGKEWASSSGDPQPTSLSLKHKQQFNPYQATPAYPDSRHQPDKHVQIQDITLTFEEGQKTLVIYIIPMIFVGHNPQEYGLPTYARTEPDYKYKKPLGCNGCSEIGLPGYRINMATLLPVIQDTLYSWSGRGPSVELALTWNAMLGVGKTNFGSGWRFSYDSWLYESSEGVTLLQDDGSQQHFLIPNDYNANVSSVVANPGTGDTTVNLTYVSTGDEPAYDPSWDGKYAPDRSGYQLEKDLTGDPGLRTFILTPPGERISYIYQGTSGNLDPLPLVAVEDWNGNRLQITRNASGAITRITDAVNRSAQLSYNASGQCTTVTVPGNKQLTFSYSGDTMVRVVDLISNQIDYSYSATNLMTEMNIEGRAWSFNWVTENDVEHLASVSDPESNITQYSIINPSFNSYRTGIIDGSGRSFSYSYPEGAYSGNSRQQAPTIVNDEKGRPVEITPKGGGTLSRYLQYNDLGLISRVDELDTGIHQYTYDDRGQITTYIDALDNTWSMQYDSAGNLTRSESPESRVLQHIYDSYGQPLQTIDPAGNIIQRTFDGYGNLQTLTDAEGTTTTFGYDANGIELTSVTDHAGNTTTFTYDDNRRRLRTTYADGSYRENIYDCCAIVGFRNENGDIRTITRSPSLKVLRETDYQGNAVNYTYDGAGRRIISRDPSGAMVVTQYSDLGLPESVKDPVGDTVSWQYYSNTDEIFSHTLSQDPPAQAEISMHWRGLPIKSNGWWFNRDKMGRLSRIITPNYRNINYTRDNDGMLIAKDYEGTPFASFTRDANGLIASASHQLGTDTYLRNGRGQVTTLTWYDGGIMNFAYNTLGQLSSMEYPDSSIATYNYDSRGRISSITWKGITLDTQYDAVGNISSEQRSNGVDSEITVDKNNQPVAIQHSTGLQTLLELQCTRNSFGLLRRCDKSGDVLSWTPPLTAGTNTAKYIYNSSFTLQTLNGEAASTDIGGNQTAIPGARAYSGTFDYQNLLTAWTTSSGSNQAVYDGQKRLIQWTHNGGIRRFHYDSLDRLLYETDENGSLTASWLYRGRQVVAMASGGEVYFYHTDLNANTAFLTDTAGTPVATYTYLPYGEKVAVMGSLTNPFTFVGSMGVIDLEDGLYYMRHRTYDALTHAFLSNDPIGLGVTPNAREYARNNPVNWIDPDGLFGFLTQYTSEGESCPRVGADFDNKVYNAPSTPTAYEESYGPSPAANDVQCIVDTAWNVATSLDKYGAGASAAKIANHLRNGEYGEAGIEGAGAAASAVSGIAGSVFNFVLVPSNGGCRYEDETGMDGSKESQDAFWNSKTRRDVESYDFTIPPFTLDE